MPVESSIGLPVAATYSMRGKFVRSGDPILYAATSHVSRKSTLARSHGVHMAVIAAIAAIREQLAELIVRQLELDQHRDDVLQALLAVARLVEDFLAVGLAELPLLELHRVGAGRDRGVHELLRDREVAVVVDADFGDHIARLPGTDPA